MLWANGRGNGVAREGASSAGNVGSRSSRQARSSVAKASKTRPGGVSSISERQLLLPAGQTYQELLQQVEEAR